MNGARASVRRTAILLLLAALGACKKEDMYSQERVQSWDTSSFFGNGSSMRKPVEGTVPRTVPDPTVPEPARIDAALLARGQQRFDIFCSPCHGRAANGEGMIVQRGFPHPPSFVVGPLRSARAQLFYDAITHGYGAMYSFADRVPDSDRWAIIAYIRALQLSQDADPARLPAQEQAALAALH